MLSNKLEITLKRALSIATDYQHEYATYEHLLLASLEDEDVIYVFEKNKVDIKLVEAKLISYIREDLMELITERFTEAKPTAGFQRIVQRATLHRQPINNSKKNFDRIEINGMHVLAEFFFEQDAYALRCLKECGLTRQGVLKIIKEQDENRNVKNQPKDDEQTLLFKENKNKLRDLIVAKPALAQLKNAKLEQEKTPEEELEKYCVNLNERANEDGIDCLIGRHNEIQRTIEILCRRKKNNAILVGEPGVGKTAIAEGLALRIVKKDVPKILEKTVIYSLDMGALVAGTKFRGDFEERIRSMLEALKQRPDSVLFIDEIHTIIGAGSTNNSSLDASNLLKPALAKGELKCIGSTTFKEYHNNFEKDMALVRRFQKVIVEEPNEEATLKILNGLIGYYEKHHGVKYEPTALKAAVTLSERYINDRHLPDKAIDLIDEAGARCKIEGKSSKKPVVTEKDIEKVITTILNIPNLTIAADEIEQLKNLEANLKTNIFGQDEAIHNLCASIKLSKAGLKKGSRPIGCYLFAGPTGVGKTELAKQLAFFCDMNLAKFDMSEYAESAAVSKLLGSPPGYVGFDQGGMLTEEIDKYPYSVVLFDEIEKAHPDMYNLLLQVMDEGCLTDSTGKEVDFSHSIIILTTNLQPTKQSAPIGFSNTQAAEQPLNMEPIHSRFTPEFRSRLDKIILFNPINGIVDKIVDKNFKELAAQLADKKVTISVSKPVKKYMSDTCFKNNSGARELDRIIDSQIKQAIADEILFGRLRTGGSVIIDFSKKLEKITFKFSKLLKESKEEETT